jgi:hypothetical protein
MDPQAPSVLTPDEINEKMSPTEPKKDNHWITIASMAAFVLLALGAVVFLYYQNQQLKKMLAGYATPVASPKPTAEAGAVVSPSSSPSATLTKPVVTSPKPGAKVISPLTVTGTVPVGFMFEGVFPIKLTDATKKVIVQGQAKEVIPGSWQSGKSVEFTVTLTFTTTAKSGFIILENDNPSGDTSKSQTFEVPVNF